jgi:RHS repeat-associated protein
MRSQLTDANISNINGGNWVAKYFFNNNGDMAYRTIQSDTDTFSYNGHQMTSADGNPLDYDENGQLTSGIGTSLIWNWDGKLRSATKGSATINLKYDPFGNRIWKKIIAGGPIGWGTSKYIIDIVGDLPTVLMEINPSYSYILKTYIYANSQIIAQHNGIYSTPRYFYLHDRLGSVRLIINTSGVVKNCYTYNPFGELFTAETTENVLNPFKFSGQFFDDEIGQYYLRARQYDPYISRFTSRDPVLGKFEEPMTMHKYLYCQNNPINKSDPMGLWDKETHDWFIDLLFPVMSEKDKSFIKQGSALIDEVYQAPEYAFMHAMRNGNDKNQSVEDARKLMMGFVDDTLDLAKKMRCRGLYSVYYLDLGMALHPLMDATSPLHMGFQEWKGYDSFSSIPHLFEEGKDNVTDDIYLLTIRSLQETIEKFDWTLMAEYSYAG